MQFIDKSLLIIEDDEDTQVLITAALSDLLVNCSVASSAEEAMAMIKENPEFDLILLDVHLPGINGFQFLRKLREGSSFEIPLTPLKIMGQDNFQVRRFFEKQIVLFNHKVRSVPVLMLTADTSDKNVKFAKSLKVSGYLGKPFNPDFLKKRVSDILLSKKKPVKN